jgi:sugar phosphate isomerase/epimerase
VLLMTKKQAQENEETVVKFLRAMRNSALDVLASDPAVILDRITAKFDVVAREDRYFRIAAIKAYNEMTVANGEANVMRNVDEVIEKSAELAAAVGASSVVVHPPFRWESSYAKNFERIVRQTAANTGVDICVENMFPWKVGTKNLKAYAPSPDPLDLDVDAMTLDFSHASLTGRDSLEYAMAMGDKLRHVHLCDGTRSVADGNLHDEHLVPGRGTQPVAETLRWLVEQGFDGHVVAEIGLHKIRNAQVRLDMLVETVAFAKEHLGGQHATREPIAVGAARINGRSVRRARKASRSA